ncbi:MULTISPECIES: HD-GYP domain-containing protein [Deefgea]|uniref:HD domain-containing protein n=1 Tax=Deefgea chitinilytica TaxID=570276 RepID=A0ABS2CBD5_9NEIS|nr:MULTISPECIES: HD domain-containing phosphohydrolase [Deefgea]MBM5571458.1 HD domain-containing protein [Deefgea chitinilytica]MBM9888691.1 HD domain-containing protein [Deefgea sp. CFH1-16]
MPPTHLSAAQHLLAARQQLMPLLALEPSEHSVVAQVTELVAHIYASCEKSADVALAMIQLDLDAPYAIRHAINVAVIVNLALQNLGQSKEERWHFVAAALTMNIGMYELQNTLSQQSTPLTDEQKIHIRQHPTISRELLRSAGVADAIWLECISQHHEAPDGSGYPLKLAGDEILFGARLIAIADRYCALLSNTTYRSSQSADVALQNSLNSDGGSIDDKLLNLFTQTIGSYPPGSVVQLNNGESGVVSKYDQQTRAPHVYALFTRDEQLYEHPPIRQCHLTEFGIHKVLDNRIVAGAMPLTFIWGAAAQR